MPVSRRTAIVRLAAGFGIAGIGPTAWSAFLADPDRPVSARAGRFGPLGAPDELGIRLPEGFDAQLIARTGDEVGDTGYTWHHAPDGGGVIPARDGGWYYASNSEIDGGGGGVSCLAFDRSGTIRAAYPILRGTSRNCAGGVTPWGTWLSCEEFSGGQVFECDPTSTGRAVERPRLGTFRHEAAAVDRQSGDVFLTEDSSNGRLYRFRPAAFGDLSRGRLFAARTAIAPAELSSGDETPISWVRTSSSEADRSETTAVFDGGEGAWMDGRRLLFTTKGDDRVWYLDLRTSRLGLLHDAENSPGTPLGGVDNITVHQRTRDVFVAEDGDDMQLVALQRARSGEYTIEPFLQIDGQSGSEIAGPAFSPDGQRLYLSSQRGSDGRGVTYEIRGPFGPDVAEFASTGPLRLATRLGRRTRT